MHPDDYFARVAAKAAASQPTWTPLPAETLAAEHLGEFHWSFLVGAANARGLRADRAVVLRGARPTVLVETFWDSPDQAARFAAAYEAFLAGRGLRPVVVRNGSSVKAAYGANRAAIDKFVGGERTSVPLPSGATASGLKSGRRGLKSALRGEAA